MADIDYKQLYSLQDTVLRIVFSEEREFYLTGGTCLSRFYNEKRLSDDLDFFTNQSLRFSYAVRRIRSALADRFTLVTETDSRDFVRLRINGILQADFINDPVPRYGEPVFLESGIIIDSVENILSNKITAVIGRDDSKDIFDLYMIWKFYSINWKDILDSAHNKAFFSNDELIARLSAFPLSMLQSIRLTDPAFLHNFPVEFPKLIEDIRNGCASL